MKWEDSTYTIGLNVEVILSQLREVGIRNRAGGCAVGRRCRLVAEAINILGEGIGEAVGAFA